MEQYTYTTNLPQCREISSERPIEVGEVISGITREPDESPFVFALVTSKINGRLALTPVKFANCWIEKVDYAAPPNQDNNIPYPG